MQSANPALNGARRTREHAHTLRSRPPVLKEHAVGERVRWLRKQAGLSLRAFASQAGFSPSFISQLENGQVSPSIHSMEKIVGTLGVTLGTFFESIQPGEGTLVMRASERGRLGSSWSNAEIEVLSRMPPYQRLEPLLIRLRPGGRSAKHPVPHRTEQFGLVLQGHVNLRLGPDEHRLRLGDAVTLRPEQLRLWANLGKKDCSVLLVALRESR